MDHLSHSFCATIAKNEIAAKSHVWNSNGGWLTSGNATVKRLLMLIAYLLLVPYHTCAEETENEHTLSQFHWLLGQWKSSSGENVTTETWIAQPGLLRGAGRVVTKTDGRIRSEEVMVILKIGKEFYYVAKPRQNRMPVPFVLRELTERRAMFENDSHDFPKRIVYERNSDGGLKVAVGDGEDRSFVIDFHRLGSADAESVEHRERESVRGATTP